MQPGNNGLVEGENSSAEEDDDDDVEIQEMKAKFN